MQVMVSTMRKRIIAAAEAIILFLIVLTITCINLTVSKKHVHYGK